MDFPAELKRHVARIERGLDLHVPPAATRPTRLHTAMRYSLEAGGKRLRPMLVLAAAELCGAAPQNDSAMPAAVAIECVHTYSLIHDDLPCMDNDDLRRGRPTAHRQFDEATALLAGDALLTHAFALLAQHYSGELSVDLTRELADAAGSRRLIGGQMEDLLAEKKSDATADELDFIHVHKTAAMIEASLVMGALVGARASGPQLQATSFPAGGRDARAPGQTTAQSDTLATWRTAGRHLGLAFQIVDDVLDATSDSATLGKTAGKDAKAGKTTYIKLHGLEASREMARRHSAAAVEAFRALPGDSSFLRALAENLVSRAS